MEVFKRVWHDRFEASATWDSRGRERKANLSLFLIKKNVIKCSYICVIKCNCNTEDRVKGNM